MLGVCVHFCLSLCTYLAAVIISSASVKCARLVAADELAWPRSQARGRRPAPTRRPPPATHTSRGPPLERADYRICPLLVLLGTGHHQQRELEVCVVGGGRRVGVAAKLAMGPRARANSSAATNHAHFKSTTPRTSRLSHFLPGPPSHKNPSLAQCKHEARHTHTRSIL